MKSSSISTAISSSNTCFFLSAKSLNFLKATSIRSSEKSGYPKETNFSLNACLPECLPITNEDFLTPTLSGVIIS